MGDVETKQCENSRELKLAANLTLDIVRMGYFSENKQSYQK
jgi:hypothetical protein